MNKIYFGLPLLVAVAFFFYASHFKKVTDEANKKHEEQVFLENQAKAMDEQARRVAQAQQAADEAEKRNAQRAADKARLQKERDDRVLANARRDKAKREVTNLKDEIKKVEREINDEQKTTDKVNEEKTGYEAERKFLVDYLAQAKKSQARLLELVAKVDDVEKKRAEAAAAAASAAKSKPSS